MKIFTMLKKHEVHQKVFIGLALLLFVIFAVAVSISRPRAVAPPAPEPQPKIVAVSTTDQGGSVTVALDDAGRIWTWGRSGIAGFLPGAFGNGVTADSSFFAVRHPLRNTAPPFSASLVLDDVSELAENGGLTRHFIVRRNDGNLWSWGLNTSGQLGVGDFSSKSVPTQVSSSSFNHGEVAQFHAASNNSIFLLDNGTVWITGQDSAGILGQGSVVGNTHTPVQVKGPGGVGFLTGIAAVSAGEGFALALEKNDSSNDCSPDPNDSDDETCDGQVWAWGENHGGVLGHLSGHSSSPTTIPTLNNIISIKSAALMAIAVKDEGGGENSTWTWGRNDSGLLGNNNPAFSQPTPVRVCAPGVGLIAVDGSCDDGSGPEYLGNILKVKGGANSILAILDDGDNSVVIWGSLAGEPTFDYGGTGSLINPHSNYGTSSVPIYVETSPSVFLRGIDHFAIGNNTHFAIEKNDLSSNCPSDPDNGNDTTCNGQLWAWGHNLHTFDAQTLFIPIGKLGDSSTLDRRYPVLVRFTHNLSVSTSGTGLGTVTSNAVNLTPLDATPPPPSPSSFTPAFSQINCGDGNQTCVAAFPNKTSVTLTATASTGSEFSHWEGSCSGTDPEFMLDMTATNIPDGDKECVAIFNLLPPPVLTVSKTGAGSGTVTSDPTGINCGNDCEETYNFNDVVTLLATPAPGSFFGGWSGACTNAGSKIFFGNVSFSNVLEFSPDGSSSSIFGSSVVPFGVAVDNTNQFLYVLDAFSSSQVKKFNFSGGLLTSWGPPGSAGGELDFPFAAEVGPDGHLYVVDSGNNRIARFSPEGEFIEMWGKGVNMTTSGDKCTAISGHTCQAGADSSATGGFSFPAGIGVASDGSFYVADFSNNRVQKFGPDGEFVFAVGDLLSPGDVAVQSNGNLFISEYDGHRIREMTPSGVFSGLEWGSLGAGGPSSFQNPLGLSIDPITGELYVGDSNNSRIQRFSFENPCPSETTEVASGVCFVNSIEYFGFGYNVAVGIGDPNQTTLTMDSDKMCVASFTSTVPPPPPPPPPAPPTPPPPPSGGSVLPLCGPAATTYPFDVNDFSGSFCARGELLGSQPPFPSPGGSATWRCGFPDNIPRVILCSATREEPPAPSVDIKANGVDRLVLQSPGVITLSWETAGVQSCGTSFWPLLETPLGHRGFDVFVQENKTFAISCTGFDGQVVNDSVVVNLAPMIRPPELALPPMPTTPEPISVVDLVPPPVVERVTEDGLGIMPPVVSAVEYPKISLGEAFINFIKKIGLFFSGLWQDIVRFFFGNGNSNF